jgi:hypothetical protein
MRDKLIELILDYCTAPALRQGDERRFPYMADDLKKYTNEYLLELLEEFLDKKDLVMYIYLGKPNDGFKDQFGEEARIQLNDKFAEVGDVPAFIYSERESKREELRPFLTTALKVDKDASMGIVGDVKQELRKVNALKINYTTRIGDVSLNSN